MAIVYGLTQDCHNVQWFDTYDEALDAHQQMGGMWQWRILVYGYAQHLGSIAYHPRHGYVWFSVSDEDGNSLLDKYGLPIGAL